MQTSRVLRFLALLALLIVAGYFLGKRFSQPRASPGKPQRPPAARDIAGSQNLAESRALSPANLLSQIFDRLRDGSLQPGDLAAMRRMLLAADPHEAMAAILSFLATGRDARTGEGFAIQRAGDSPLRRPSA